MSSKGSVLLLTGPEEGEKQLYIKNLIDKKTKELGEAPEIYKYYPFEADILDVVTLLNSGSLFSNYKIVILGKVDEVKKPSDQALLVEYCQSPADDATFIMTTSQISLGAKKLTASVGAKNKVTFWEMNEGQKKGWVINFFRQRKISIHPEALDFFVELIEGNTRDLKMECNRLSIFFGPESEITTEDIETYVYHSKEENVFTLFDKIAARNLPGALEVLDKMILSGEGNGIAIVSGLLWQVRRIQSFKTMKENNYNVNEIFRSLGIMSKKSQRIYLEAHKRYSAREITSILLLLNDFDVRLRNFKTDTVDLLIQLLLYYTIVKGGIMPALEPPRWY